MVEKKVVILGVSGFIGSHVAEQFRESGWRVRALARLSSNRQALESFADEVVQVDFASEDSIAEALSGFDTVVNCIATVRLNTTLVELNKVQVGITEAVARAAVRAAVKHLLLLSTVEIYGFKSPFRKSETLPYQPEFNFQQSFVDKEEVFRRVLDGTDTAYTILQPASTIGRREIASSFFRPLFDLHVRNTYLLINGGKAAVSLVDTRDIGRAMVHLACLEQPSNETYLAKGYDTSWRSVKQEIDRVTGRRARELALPSWLLTQIGKFMELITPSSRDPLITPLAVRLMSVDVLIDDEKLRRTGFSTIYNLSDSVEDAISWFLSQS